VWMADLAFRCPHTKHTQQQQQQQQQKHI